MKNIAHRRILLAAAAAVAALLLCKEVSFFLKAHRIDFEKAARGKLMETANTINEAFTKARTLSDSIAGRLSGNAYSKASICHTMTTYCEQFPIDGLFFAIEDSSGRPSPREYALMLKKQGNMEFIDVPNFRSGSYAKTLRQGKTWWTGAVFDSIYGARVAICYVPFHLRREGKRGVVGVIYQTTHIYERIQHLGLSRYGFPYIMDSASHYIAHPLDEMRSMSDIARGYRDEAMLGVEDDVRSGALLSKRYRHVNTVTGKECSEVFFPIRETAWFLGLSVYDGHSLESAAYHSAMKRSGIRIALYALMLLLALTVLVGAERAAFRQAAYYYWLPPCLFLAAIVAIIGTYSRFPGGAAADVEQEGISFDPVRVGEDEQRFLDEHKIFGKWDPRRIVDTQSLSAFVSSYSRQSQLRYGEEVKTIPTGVYLHNLQFLSSYEVKMSGVVWQKFLASDAVHPAPLMQKYHTDAHEYKGCSFPGAYAVGMQLTDSIVVLLENQKAVLMRWKFEIEISQHLSYALYPFGKSSIVLPIWSTNLDDNTLLTPDLGAYHQVYPDVCPGLSNHFNINGWDVLNSYYSYSIESYLCNFGNVDIYSANRFPDLTFNISVSRKFIDTLVCKIIPLLVVLALLFTVLFVRNDSDGFNNVIGCSGLFFVLVFDHINLRTSIQSGGIMYLEYCYFFTYMLLLLITATAFYAGSSDRRVKRRYRMADGILKRYFWSIILGAMVVTTALIFY